MRRRRAEKREKLPDAKYGDILVSTFINAVMLDGKRSKAEKSVYDAFEKLQTKVKDPVLKSFHQIIDAVRPYVEVRSRRVGGATYQVPSEIPESRSRALSIRWIITAARARGEKTMWERLLGEFNDILAGRGAALKKREEVHKMAEANKAFAHYRW